MSKVIKLALTHMPDWKASFGISLLFSRTMTTSTVRKGGCPRDWPGTSHLSSFLTFPSPCLLSWAWTPSCSTPPSLMAQRTSGSVFPQPLRGTWWERAAKHSPCLINSSIYTTVNLLSPFMLSTRFCSGFSSGINQTWVWQINLYSENGPSHLIHDLGSFVPLIRNFNNVTISFNI